MKSFSKTKIIIILIINLNSMKIFANGKIALIGPKIYAAKIHKIQQIIFDKLLIPKDLVEVFFQKSCQTSSNYDLVICLDDENNGNITFPIYKQRILQNTYKAFLD